MSHTIQVSEDNRYIVIIVKGEITRKDAVQQNLEAHALGKKMGINKYLVDVTEARNIDSVQNNYDFAYTDMRHTEGIDKLARVAAIVSPGDHSHDFIETVSRNAGFNVTIFNDPEEAKQHLLRE